MGLKISMGSTFLYCFVVYLCISLFIFLQDNKKLVRYRDNQVVSTKGERFSWVKQQENEEMKKTYVNLKPARKYRFHWVNSYTCRCEWVRGSQLPPYGIWFDVNQWTLLMKAGKMQTILNFSICNIAWVGLTFYLKVAPADLRVNTPLRFWCAFSWRVKRLFPQRETKKLGPWLTTRKHFTFRILKRSHQSLRLSHCTLLIWSRLCDFLWQKTQSFFSFFATVVAIFTTIVIYTLLLPQSSLVIPYSRK